MLIGHDPVAHEVFVELDDGREPVCFPVTGPVTIMCYGGNGEIAIVVEGEAITLTYLPDPDLVQPGVFHLEPDGHGTWAVRVTHR